MLIFDPEKSHPAGSSTAASTHREPLSSRMKRVQDTRLRSSNSASIPYKHKVVIVDVPKDKAFGATSTRFQYRKEIEQKEGPGPGDYQLYRETIWTDNRQSYSRKGNTNFLSKVFRTNKTHEFYNTGPGPGAYNESELENLKKNQMKHSSAVRIKPNQLITTRSSFNKSSQFFKKQQSDVQKLGPGVYHPENFTLRPLTNSAGVGFKSRTARTNIPLNKDGLSFPDSWNYNLSRNILKAKPESLHGLSSFSQPVITEKKISTKDYEAVKKTVLAKDEQEAAKLLKPGRPGPGSYKLQNDFDKLVQENYEHRLKMSGPFSKLGTPRLTSTQATLHTPREESRTGVQWVANNNPGPGAYDPFEGFPEDKFDKSDHVFVSSTKREAFQIKQPVDITAPYTPTLAISRRSYNKSKQAKWF